MRSGNVAAGKDHYHQRRTDGQRGNDTGRSANDRATDGQNEEECPNQFADIFVHDVLFVVRPDAFIRSRSKGARKNCGAENLAGRLGKFPWVRRVWMRVAVEAIRANPLGFVDNSQQGRGGARNGGLKTAAALPKRRSLNSAEGVWLKSYPSLR